SRSTTNSRYKTDQSNTDTAVSNATSAKRALDPVDDLELGGSVDDVNSDPTGTGTFNVADLTIAVGSTLGTFSLVTSNSTGGSASGTGQTESFTGAGPGFNPGAFDNQGLYTVTVIAAPEPTSIGFLALAGFGLLHRRRKTAWRE